jgi:hypothetical protein
MPAFHGGFRAFFRSNANENPFSPERFRVNDDLSIDLDLVKGNKATQQVCFGLRRLGTRTEFDFRRTRKSLPRKDRRNLQRA